jgi:tetratricopeptide (TPR) repeat protein
MSTPNRIIPSVLAALLLTSTPALSDSQDQGMQHPPQTPATLDQWAQGARIFTGLGTTHRKISTQSADAQRFFDQGMRLMWAFNHDESSRSFARAAQLDPRCGICLWGFALTVGPNYNMPMMAESRAKAAFQSLQRAVKVEGSATPVERDLIEALRVRYPEPVALDPSNIGPVLRAYADAMREVAHRYPNDSDVQTMFAESMMNINAWRLWTPDGKPAEGTEEIVSTLEAVLARDPHHPGANHYYVHAIEASPHPEKAVAAAERLRGMMPAAGHLEHMPAHIMQRVGRYEDAAEANRKGAAADRVYFDTTRPLDYYGMYFAHNYQFLAYSAAMEGRRAETLATVQQAGEVFPEQMMLDMPGSDWYGAEAYLALVRFAAWDRILELKAPNPALKALTGGYLFARATALAAKGRVAEAQQALQQLEKVRASVEPDAGAGINNSVAGVLTLAATVGRARVELAQHKRDRAISTLQQAALLEDGLAYDEPSAWFFPVRHLLGAELIAAGRFKEAEAVYREDLRRNPHNGWSLFGLAQALTAQKKTAEAAQVGVQFQQAWKHADIKLASSQID